TGGNAQPTIVTLAHGELRRGDAERGTRDRIGEPVGVAVQARVARGNRESIADRPARPAVAVVTGFGEHGADRERRARMHRRERPAGISPVINARGFVRPTSTRGVLE